MAQIKSMLKGEENPRNYLLFSLGINFALRVQDLLGLRVRDVLRDDKTIKDFLFVRERKRGRQRRIKINARAREALEYYFSKVQAKPDDYLFPSPRDRNRPLSRVQAYRLINQWVDAVGLTEGRYGTHTLRKTWGYQARKHHGVPIELIMEKLGHESPAVTKRYIGITDDEIEDVEDEVVL
ncbi:MAG: tyrosine-type recombinase/integrase [Candidatus Acetothermia bacterium]|nr:tyrosine-type recombinase/integrase [Candidatus Acetothermia bacterium]